MITLLKINNIYIVAIRIILIKTGYVTDLFGTNFVGVRGRECDGRGGVRVWMMKRRIMMMRRRMRMRIRMSRRMVTRERGGGGEGSR